MKDRHKEFADTYLANGYNARKAYMACYPDCKPNSADVLAYRLLNREDVKEYIDTQRKLMFESRRVDMYRWVEEIANIAFAEKGDMVYTTGDKNGIKRVKSTSHTAGNQYVVSVNSPSLIGKTVGEVGIKWVAYLVYTDPNGNLVTVYSDPTTPSNLTDEF